MHGQPSIKTGKVVEHFFKPPLLWWIFSSVVLKMLAALCVLVLI